MCPLRTLALRVTSSHDSLTYPYDIYGYCTSSTQLRVTLFTKEEKREGERRDKWQRRLRVCLLWWSTPCTMHLQHMYEVSRSRCMHEWEWTKRKSSLPLPPAGWLALGFTLDRPRPAHEKRSRLGGPAVAHCSHPYLATPLAEYLHTTVRVYLLVYSCNSCGHKWTGQGRICSIREYSYSPSWRVTVG